MNVLSPLPWPRWHRMPPPDVPFPVRWSYEAWEALYGQPWERHWKPWPHEAEENERTRQERLARLPKTLRDAVASANLPPESLAEAIEAEEHMFLQGFVNTYEPKPPPTGAAVWENILALYKMIEENGTLRPMGQTDLRIYRCPDCLKPQYAPGACALCQHGALVHDQRKPVKLDVITQITST